MTPRILLLTTLATGLLAACGTSPGTPAAAIDTRAVVGAPAGATVATVNGEVITEPMLDVFAKGRGLDPSDPTARQRALDALVENVLLAQAAYSRGLGERPDVQAEVALVRLQQLAGRTMADLRSGIEVTEDQARAYYDAEAARTGGIEVHLKHILFDDEASARAAADVANAPGADFDALLAEFGSGSARQARDLGWANLTQLPSEMAEAVKKMADGEVARAPLQTSFGWHVFKREASRPYTPPPYEEVRDGARRHLLEKSLADQVQALRDAATIEIPTSAAQAADPG